MRDFAESFYKSKAWERCRYSFLESKNWICEQCGEPAELAHHIISVEPWNIHDPTVTLNHENLMAVCRKCHGLLHSNMTLSFDVSGNVDAALKTDSYQTDLENLLTKLNPPQG